MASSKLRTASQAHKELMLEAAIRSVKDGMSQNGAATMYDVSRSTMRNRLKDPAPRSVGKSRKFTFYEEERIAEFLSACSKQGIPFNRHHCMRLFSQVAAELRK